MLAKDSVQARLAAGMSFTEFSYQTLQAADFLHLHQHEGVDLQMGGADQWGNITAGLELIRRVEARERRAGRSGGRAAAPSGSAARCCSRARARRWASREKGAVFLDPALTSPYDFYQYWINDDDVLVIDHLRWLTTMTAERGRGDRGRAPRTAGGTPRAAGARLRPDRPDPRRGGGGATGRARRGGLRRRTVDRPGRARVALTRRSAASSSGPRPRPGRSSMSPWPPVPARVARRGGSSRRAASPSTGSA